jgi:opacity protein-like surface antigen
VKSSLSAIIVAGGALGLASAAHAEGIYGKVEAGGTFSGNYAIPGPDAKLDNGWEAGATLGGNVIPNVRVEGEISHQKSDFKGAPGDSEATFGLANVYYDFPTGGTFKPFVGAGVGVGKLDTGADDDTGLAYKLTGGLAKEFSNGVTGEVAYRYTAAPNLKLSGVDADYHESAITAGVRLKFGQ